MLLYFRRGKSLTLLLFLPSSLDFEEYIRRVSNPLLSRSHKAFQR
jgi:hypothetical protein